MFSEFSTKYFERDLVVIPLRGKAPVIKNWSKFAEVFPSDMLIDSWEKKYSKFNIGLLCGKLSGVVAVDIDKDSALDMVPLSPVVKRGAKGETRFFKYNGEVNFKRHDLGIELLSNGNQTVIPPSVHPDTGQAYKWTTPDTLLDYDIDDLPVLPDDWFDAVGAKEVLKGDSKGRHNTLVEIASAMVGRQETIDDIVKELVDYDEKNHDVPYFTDASEPHGGRGQAAALNMVTSVINTHTRKGKKYEPFKLEIRIGQEEVEKQIEESQQTLPDVVFPEPPGLIREIRDVILSRSQKPRPKFALASALALVGTVTSNRIKYRDSTPNLYQLIVADSGEGKDVPLKSPKKLLVESGLFKFVGLDSYRGDKSLVKKLEGQRERIDTIDEVSKLFRSINSNQNIFMSNIAEVLTEIWNSSNELFMGFTTSEGTTGMVFNPCLSLMGATTPDAFSHTFSSQNLMQGFGARFLYVFDEKRVDLVDPEPRDVPETVKDFLYYWGNLNLESETVDISETASFKLDLGQAKPTATVLKDIEKPNPTELPMNDDAAKYLNETMHHFHELGYHCDPTVRPIVLRAYQQTKKIMLISAAATSPIHNPAPIIKKSDVAFARQYVEASIKNTQLFFAENLIQSRFHRDSQKVLKVLKRNPKGLTKAELTKALRKHFRASDLYDKKSGLITNLVEADKVKAFEVKDGESKKKKLIFVYNFQASDA